MPDAPFFRRPDGAPPCPICTSKCSIQHYNLPIYGHYCLRREAIMYWTQPSPIPGVAPSPALAFLSLSALIELLLTGDEAVA